jgi:hypothetical protein
LGFRGIERVTGINHNSVINWVRQAEAALPEENYEIPVTAQIDELQTFVGDKKQSLALSSRKYEVAWHSQVRRGQPLPRNISLALAADSLSGNVSCTLRMATQID